MIDDIIDKYNCYMDYSFRDLHLGIVHPVLNKTQYIPGDRKGDTYIDAVPNDKRTSIVYWEDFGSRAISISPRATRFMNTVRLVCWLNMSRIHGLSYGDCVRAIWGAAPRFMPGDRSIYFHKAGQLHKSMDIFSRYNYREGKQYVTAPLDAFAIDFNVYYFMNDNCFVS
jgi:hypothetical protein